jgi:hypothetical protein
MCREVIAVLLVAGLVAAVAPSSASAQTLVPPVGELIGGDDDAAEPKPEPDQEKCGHGVTLICAGDTLIDSAAGAAGDVVGGAVGSAGDAVMGGIVDWAASGAAWLVTEIGQQIDKSTRPAIGSTWFGAQYAAVRQLAVALSVLFLLAAIVHAVIRQDIRLLAYSVLVALPMALLLTFTAVILVELSLAVTDWMTAQALTSLGRDSERAFERLGDLLQPGALSGNPLPGLVMFFAAVLTAVLALVVWIELVLREASIYVAVSFLPISFVAMIWRPTASWARRLTEWLGAIVLAKFTIAVAFAIAGSALAHSSRAGGLTTLLAGCAVLLVAALTPWVLLRMLPGSTGAAHGLHRGVVRQAAGSTTGATTATMATRQVIMRSFPPAAVGAAARRPAGTPHIPAPPTKPPDSSGGPKLDPPARRQRAKVG